MINWFKFVIYSFVYYSFFVQHLIPDISSTWFIEFHTESNALHLTLTPDIRNKIGTIFHLDLLVFETNDRCRWFLMLRQRERVNGMNVLELLAILYMI